MATQKKSPEVRFDGFKEDWETNSFENLTKINQGLQISITNRFKKRIPQSHFYITNEFLKEGAKSEYYILNPPESVLCTNDDVLMTRTGNTGEVVTGVNGAFHNNFFKIKFDREKIDKDYLVYFLKNEATQSLILRLAGVSTIPDLNHNDFYQIEMPFPVDIKEQNKISQLLGNLDSLLKNHQTQLKKLTNLKKAMLIKMFPQDGASVPEIRFKGFDGEWEVTTLGNISKITTGSSNREDSGLDGEFTFFDRSEDIRRSNIFLFDCEAIIVAGEGSDFIPKYYKGKFDLHQRTYAIMDFEESDGRYIFYYIHLFRNYFLDVAVGSTVKSLRLPMFQNMPIAIPTKQEEQQKIGNYFKNLDDLIENHKEQLKKLNQIKKACLSKLFVSQD